jgi:hypothetical protein
VLLLRRLLRLSKHLLHLVHVSYAEAKSLLPFFKGVPAHKAIWYCCKLVREILANNPYDLYASFYLIDEETSKTSTETALAEYLPWYKGGIKGVPAHKAVGYCCKLVKETFDHNPYGLYASFYVIAGLDMLAVLYGNFVVAVIEGYQAGSFLLFFKGLLNGLVIFWVFPFFLHPALDSTVQQMIHTKCIFYIFSNSYKIYSSCVSNPSSASSHPHLYSRLALSATSPRGAETR